MTRKMDKQLAEKIKIFMMKNEITQRDLAKKMGLTPQAISHFLNGSNSLRTDTLDRISAALGTDSNYFFADVNGNGNAIGNNNNTRLEAELKNDINFIKKELEVQKLQIENLTLKIEKLQKKK